MSSETNDNSAADHDARLETLRRQQEELKAQMARLDTQVSDALSQRNRSTKISRLPDEVLENVLILAVDRGERLPPRTDVAVVLSHVSKRWRHVALCAHTLWTDVFFGIGIRSWETAMEMNKEWLSRSGTRPLYITMCYSGEASRTISFGVFDEAVELIIRELPRCYCLRLDFDIPPDLENVLGRCLGAHPTLPGLATLELACEGHRVAVDAFPASLPNLRIVKLGIAPPVMDPESSGRLCHAMGNLDKMHLKGCSYVSLLLVCHFVKQSPHLQALTLEHYEFFGEFPLDLEDDNIVKLDALQSLQFDRVIPAYCDQFLRAITAPNLLKLEVKPGAWNSSPAELIQTLKRSVFASHLQELSISDLSMTSGAIVLFLVEFPNLISLRMARMNITDELLAMLRRFETVEAGRTHSSMILPALEKLDLSYPVTDRRIYRWPEMPALTPAAILALVQTRTTASQQGRATPISFLRMYGFHFGDVETDLRDMVGTVVTCSSETMCFDDSEYGIDTAIDDRCCPVCKGPV